MCKRKAAWFVKSEGAILCRDGKWRQSVDANDIKTYSSEGRLRAAMRHKRRPGIEWDAYAVYEWDMVDGNGNVRRGVVQPETLADWCRKHGRAICNQAGGTCVVSYVGDHSHNELYRLRDYAVSTVSCGVAWMVPRCIILKLAQEKNSELAS